MKTYDYEKLNLNGSGMENSIYGLLIYPRTTTEIQKFIYGISKSSDANITPLAKRRGEMEKLGFIEREDYAKLRNVKFKSNFEPFICYLKEEALSDSSLKLTEDTANGILKILDSEWFREYYSNEFILSQLDFECYRNFISISKRGMNFKFDSFKIFAQIGCMLCVIGTISHSLSELYHSLGYENPVTLENILKADNFDELIYSIDHRDIRINIASRFMDDIKELTIELPNFKEVGNNLFESDDPKIDNLFPYIFLKHLILIPAIIPPKISEILMRAGRPQQTLYWHFLKPMVENIYEEFKTGTY